jgi:hypothetical protein
MTLDDCVPLDPLSQIVPLDCLSLLSWSELEAMVCGPVTIDVDMLSRHTGKSATAAPSPSALPLYRSLHRESDSLCV